MGEVGREEEGLRGNVGRKGAVATMVGRLGGEELEEPELRERGWRGEASLVGEKEAGGEVQRREEAEEREVALLERAEAKTLGSVML